MSAGFWTLALRWLPIVERTDFLVSAAAWMDGVSQPATHVYLYLLVSSAVSLVILAPMGLPSALLCREVWRSGYRRVAWAIGAVILTAAVVLLSSGKESIYALQWDHRLGRARAKCPDASPACVGSRLHCGPRHSGLDRGHGARASPESAPRRRIVRRTIGVRGSGCLPCCGCRRW